MKTRLESATQQRRFPPAIVVGLGLTGLGVVRSLRDGVIPNSIPIIALDSDLSEPTARTRLCAKHYCADVDGNGLVDCLIELGRRYPERPVLLLSKDLAVLTVARHQELLAPLYRFLLPTPEVTDLLMDKTRFAAYAETHGFEVPRTFVLHSAGDLAAAIADNLPFPCVLKPCYRNATWNERGYPKGFLCDDAGQLHSAYDEVRNAQESFVLQEWIPGNDSDIYFCLVYFDERSRPVATFSGRKLRQWPIGAGSTSLAEAADCPAIERETVRLFTSLEFRGLGSVEFKRDPRTGRFKILEPTVGRVNLQSETATANGVNLAGIAYAHLAGLEVERHRQPAQCARWVNEYADLKSGLLRVRQGQLSVRDWVRSYRGSRRYAWFCWKDPLPSMVMGARLVAKALRGDLGTVGKSFSRAEHAVTQDAF